MTALDTTRALIFVILGPISLLACLFNLSTLIALQKRRVLQDIFAMASIYQACIAINLIMNGTYYLVHEEPMDLDSPTCKASAFLQIVGMCGNFIYSLLFTFMVGSSLSVHLRNSPCNKVKSFHVVVNVLLIALPAYAIHKGHYGFNEIRFMEQLHIDSVCGIEYGWWEFGVNCAFFLIYIVLAIHGIQSLTHQMPGRDALLEMKQRFTRYYKKLILAMLAVWSIVIFCDLVYITTNHEDKHFIPTQILEVLGLLTFPMVLCFIRTEDPKLREKMISLVGAYILGSSKDKKEPLNEDTSGGIENAYDPEAEFVCFGCKVRLGLIITILSGVSISCKENQFNREGSIDQDESVRPNSTNLQVFELSVIECKKTLRTQKFQDASKILQSKFDFDTGLLSQTVKLCLSYERLDQEVVLDEELKGFDFVQCQVTLYCPQVFRRLQLADPTIDIYEAFRVQNNKHIVGNFTGPSGGKSGEFFFFTSDSKLLMKTVTDKELQNILRRMNGYLLHFLQNPDSLICRILGLYSFARCQKKELYHTLVMRSVSSIPRKYILRTYDMKGSTYDRSALGSQKLSLSQIQSKTLKDLDFDALEGKVWVSESDASALKRILCADADFFKEMALMDYSLLVMKLNLQQFADESQRPIEEILRENFPSYYHCVKSTKEKGIYYAFGIIDYLQDWNLQKNLEKNVKKLINRSMDLDTSSQDPFVYGERFKAQLINKIF